MKNSPVGLCLAVLFLASSAARAEEVPAHDYSRATLLYILKEADRSDKKPEVVLEYSTPSWTFRFLPLMTPIVVNRSFGTASLMPPVDPLSLLSLDFPQTAETYPDRGPQNRYRRKMLALVTAANKADKARRLGGG